jgi:dihydropteroate synthase
MKGEHHWSRSASGLRRCRNECLPRGSLNHHLESPQLVLCVLSEPEWRTKDEQQPTANGMEQAVHGEIKAARKFEYKCEPRRERRVWKVMLWQTGSHTFDFARRGAIMGVLNVTPDSFSDGGLWLDHEAAVTHGLALISEGAEIIDVGGESTRPGAEPVAEEEEIRRVIPVIERLVSESRGRPVVLSIDTMKPGVAEAAVAAGASIINDVSGLRDPAMLAVVRKTGAAAIIMHMQGEPRTMQVAPHYTDVIGEVRESFRQAFDSCLACDIDPMRVAFDPGIGFGKTLEHNLTLLRDLESTRVSGRPLVLGISRKSFLGKLVNSPAMEDRSWPTVALTSFLRERGAQILRVHEVASNVQALRMTEAILG